MSLGNHVLQHEEGLYITQCPNVPIPTHDDSNPPPPPVNPHSPHFFCRLPHFRLSEEMEATGMHSLNFSLSLQTQCTPSILPSFSIRGSAFILQVKAKSVPWLGVLPTCPPRTCCSHFPLLSPICPTSSSRPVPGSVKVVFKSSGSINISASTQPYDFHFHSNFLSVEPIFPIFIFSLPKSLTFGLSSYHSSEIILGISQVVQWLRIPILVQRSQVQSLVWELKSHLPWSS